jgi:hypothetical protein
VAYTADDAAEEIIIIATSTPHASADTLTPEQSSRSA